MVNDILTIKELKLQRSIEMYTEKEKKTCHNHKEERTANSSKITTTLSSLEISVSLLSSLKAEKTLENIFHET